MNTLYKVGGYFVLLDPDSPKKPHHYAYTEIRPSVKETVSHALLGYPLGLVPASVGCTTVDVDYGDATHILSVHPAVVAYPSTSPGHHHLWYCDSIERHKYNFSVLGCSGQVISGHNCYIAFPSVSKMIELCKALLSPSQLPLFPVSSFPPLYPPGHY